MALVHVRDLGKRYSHYHPERPRTLQETFLKGIRRLSPTDYFWALRHINLEIDSGTVLGIIGSNGAGKSTLLRLAGGVGVPDEGRVDVFGRVGALLDLTTGFHPDLTGRENVIISGVIAGLTRQQVEQRFDSIVSFAELDEFIDSPLRTYSSGMQMRLGFAVAVHTEPDILLIDEVLMVGDISFQQKCLESVAAFRDLGCAILVVAHDLELLRSLCDQVVWLESGSIAAYGKPADTIDQYLKHTQPQPAHFVS